jgi:hypothetical protein
MRAINGLILACSLLGACGSDGVDSNEEARRAYLALDASIGKSLTLGFLGFGAGDNANIPDQMTTGVDTGTLLITGKVDAGNSDNKGMMLNVGMVDYSDGPVIINDDDDTVLVTYDTDADEALQPLFDMKLMNYPNGTFTGTLIGTYLMSGDIEGEVDLNVTFSGQTQDDGTGLTERKPGTITITGTVLTSDDGTFDVDVTL